MVARRRVAHDRTGKRRAVVHVLAQHGRTTSPPKRRPRTPAPDGGRLGEPFAHDDHEELTQALHRKMAAPGAGGPIDDPPGAVLAGRIPAVDEVDQDVAVEA